MVVSLTKAQTKVYLKLKENPGITAQDLSKKLGMRVDNVRSVLTALRIKEALVIDKSVTPCRYTAIDIVHTEGNASYAPKENVVIDKDDFDKSDLVMQAIASFEFTDEQWQFVQRNRHLTRSQLAKKLGIDRLELATAIIKRQGKK